MILSVHIADVGASKTLKALRLTPGTASTPGLRYAEVMLAAPLRPGRMLAPQLGRVVLVAAWDDDPACDSFLAHHPLAELLERGWHVRLVPLRAYGRWSELPNLPSAESSLSSDPVAVLTLGRLRLRRLPAFLSTSGKAERQAVAHPALLAGTALARPPRLVATFSLWRTTREMREYAVGHEPGHHLHAIEAHRARAFHRESVFARFRPYAAQGLWNGRNPMIDHDLAEGAAPRSS